MTTMVLAVVAACGGLAFLAYFSLDEIQRRNEMRAWYHGGLLATLFGFMALVLLMSNSVVEAMAGLLPYASAVPARLRAPTFYFGLGAVALLGVQVTGHLIAHAVFKIADRAR
jgi:hypothetical protein